MDDGHVCNGWVADIRQCSQVVSMSRWKVAGVYVAIWSIGALIMLGLLVAEVLPVGVGWLCILLLWLWTAINLVQVARGKRRHLWS